MEEEHFRLRALSLVEMWLKKRSSSPLALRVPVPLLQTASPRSCNATLKLRILKLLERLCGDREYPRGNGVDMGEVHSVLESCFLEADQAGTRQVAMVAGTCAMWVLKIAKAQNPKMVKYPEGDPFITTVVGDALTRSLLKKKSALPPAFFVGCFNRNPWLPVFVSARLLQQCRDGRTEYIREEATRLVTPLLRRRPVYEGMLDAVLSDPTVVDDLLVAIPAGKYNKANRWEDAVKLCTALVGLLSYVPKDSEGGERAPLHSVDVEAIQKAIETGMRMAEKQRTRDVLKQYLEAVEGYGGNGERKRRLHERAVQTEKGGKSNQERKAKKAKKEKAPKK